MKDKRYPLHEMSKDEFTLKSINQIPPPLDNLVPDTLGEWHRTFNPKLISNKKKRKK
jgi:hypothetical protein